MLRLRDAKSQLACLITHNSIVYQQNPTSEFTFIHVLCDAGDVCNALAGIGPMSISDHVRTTLNNIKNSTSDCFCPEHTQSYEPMYSLQEDDEDSERDELSFDGTQDVFRAYFDGDFSVDDVESFHITSVLSVRELHLLLNLKGGTRRLVRLIHNECQDVSMLTDDYNEKQKQRRTTSLYPNVSHLRRHTNDVIYSGVHPSTESFWYCRWNPLDESKGVVVGHDLCNFGGYGCYHQWFSHVTSVEKCVLSDEKFTHAIFSNGVGMFLSVDGKIHCVRVDRVLPIDLEFDICFTGGVME